MGTDDEGDHKYEERERESSVEGRKKRERLRSILKKRRKKSCRDRGERGARIPRLYKNTKTFYKPASYPCIVSRYKGEKDGRVQKARTGRLQRMNAWEGG